MATDLVLEDWQIERANYSDAELYRLLAAKFLVDGVFASMAEMDHAVRALGDLESANKIIEFRAWRPGCVAADYGDEGFRCACGVQWIGPANQGPKCKMETFDGNQG